MSPFVLSTLTVIALKYFSNHTCLYHFGNDDINIQSTSIVKLTKPFNNITIKIMDRIKCEGFLITGEDVVKVVNMIEHNLRYSKVFRFNKREYLLVEDGDVNVDEYFNANVFRSLVNVLLVITNNDCLEFFTHQYTGNSSQNLVNLGKACNGTDVNKLELYTNKFHNLLGRELRITSFTYLPYVNLVKDSGAEWSMVNSFVDKYNFTKKLIPTNDKWGTLFNNFSGTGMTGLVVGEEADFGVGCFYQMLPRRVLLDFSTGTMRNALTFLVPKPQLSAGIDVPLKPFQFGPWFMLITTLFILAACYTVANKFYKRYKGHFLFGRFLFEIYGVLLSQNMNLRIRFFGVLCFYYAMLMTIFYNSVLSSIMTKPIYAKYIQTGHDLAASDVQILGLSNSYVSVLNENAYGKIISKFKNVTPNAFDNILKRTKYLALAIDHLDLGFSLSEYSDVLNLERLEEFVLLEEDLSFESCTMIGVKHSVLMPLLDTHVARLKETGLDYYWQAESFRNLDYKKHLYLDRFKSVVAQFNQLEQKHVSGAFTILIFGYILGLLQFFYERYRR